MPHSSTPSIGELTGAGLKAPSRALSDAQIDSTLAFLASLTGEVPRRGDQTIYTPKDRLAHDKPAYARAPPIIACAGSRRPGPKPLRRSIEGARALAMTSSTSTGSRSAWCRGSVQGWSMKCAASSAAITSSNSASRPRPASRSPVLTANLRPLTSEAAASFSANARISMPERFRMRSDGSMPIPSR